VLKSFHIHRGDSSKKKKKKNQLANQRNKNGQRPEQNLPLKDRSIVAKICESFLPLCSSPSFPSYKRLNLGHARQVCYNWAIHTLALSDAFLNWANCVPTLYSSGSRKLKPKWHGVSEDKPWDWQCSQKIRKYTHKSQSISPLNLSISCSNTWRSARLHRCRGDPTVPGWRSNS
jgi:hypothetical protein